MTLMEAVLKAHHESALRGNCSHHALGLAAFGSGDYFKAIAAGLLTLGGLHGPLTQVYDLLTCPDKIDRVRSALKSGKRIPGWGTHFVVGEPDPAWEECHRLLEQESPALFASIEEITGLLHCAKKIVYPNPSCYTAAAAIASGIPRSSVGEILIRGRLAAWTQEYSRIVSESKELLA